MKQKQMHIDLSGPFGNAFFLEGVAYLISKHIGKDGIKICERMHATDYNNLLDVFMSEFGDFVHLKNMPVVNHKKNS